MTRSAHFITDDKAPLAGTLDFEDLDDRAISGLDGPQDALVNLKGILTCFFEEYGVGDITNVRLAVFANRRARGEVALGHEIAAQLLRCCGRDRTSGTESLETVAVARSCVVKVKLINSTIRPLALALSA